MLDIENLSFTYPDGNKALQDISFSIDKGEKVFFHGANGSGKTTLFQCLIGLLKINKGLIKINGEIIKKEKHRMRKISIVFQNADDQIIAGSVFDEVSFAPINMGLSFDEVNKRVDKALKIMNIEHLKDRPPHFLSYGQKKRVAIASVLSMEPEIIILDEPTAGMDVKQTKELVKIINNLALGGTTLLISTHDSEFTYKCADKVLVIEKGQVIAFDETTKIFSNDKLLLKANLEKPIIMDIFKSMVKVNLIIEKDLPKTREEMISIIESIKH